MKLPQSAVVTALKALNIVTSTLSWRTDVTSDATNLQEAACSCGSMQFRVAQLRHDEWLSDIVLVCAKCGSHGWVHSADDFDGAGDSPLAPVTS